MVLALTALVWIVFGQTAHFGWVRYDDHDYVYRSGRVTSGLSFSNLAWAFTHFHAANWHPITTLSHMLDCQLFGVNPAWHHFSSVVIHALATIALFFALDSLTEKKWRSAFVAGVFAIHPLRAESVAWIAERKDVLSGLFFALTLLAWSYYARRKSVTRYLLAVLAAALGTLSKPMLVTIPFVLLLIDYWPLNRFRKEKFIWLVLVYWHVGAGNWNRTGWTAGSCRSLHLFAAHRYHDRHSVAGCRTDGALAFSKTNRRACIRRRHHCAQRLRLSSNDVLAQRRFPMAAHARSDDKQ